MLVTSSLLIYLSLFIYQTAQFQLWLCNIRNGDALDLEEWLDKTSSWMRTQCTLAKPVYDGDFSLFSNSLQTQWLIKHAHSSVVKRSTAQSRLRQLRLTHWFASCCFESGITAVAIICRPYLDKSGGAGDVYLNWIWLRMLWKRLGNHNMAMP